MPDLSYAALPTTGDPNTAASVNNPLNEVKTYVNGAGWVDANRLAALAVSAAKLQDNAVSAAKIAAAAVESAKLADGAVTEAKIAAGAVTAAKIAPDAVGNAQLQDNSVGGSELQVNSVGGSTLVAGSVGNTKLADGAVTESKLATDAVTTAKIANLAVTGAEIATGAITFGKIAADAVGTLEIVDSAVTAAKLAPGAVAGALSDDSVAKEKLTRTPFMRGYRNTALDLPATTDTNLAWDSSDQTGLQDVFTSYNFDAAGHYAITARVTADLSNSNCLLTVKLSINGVLREIATNGYHAGSAGSSVGLSTVIEVAANDSFALTANPGPYSGSVVTGKPWTNFSVKYLGRP